MIDLQRRLTRYFCVLNYPFTKKLSAAIDGLNSINGLTYFLMVHDKDINVNGDLKTQHIHLGVIYSKRVRGQTLLYLLCDIFGCNENQIQISEMLSLAGAVQYLTHKNDISKFQYDYDNIISNLPKGDLNELYNQRLTDEVITFDLLYNLIVDEKYDFGSLVRRIGMERYIHYRTLIIDMYKVYKGTYLE